MKKHQNEMIRFAKTEPETIVWFRLYGQLGWNHTKHPSWSESYEYIVADDYTLLRMAQADGKVIESRMLSEWLMGCTNGDKVPWNTDFEPKWNMPPEMYRIKPDIKELTISEISELLGYDVKVVKESKEK